MEETLWSLIQDKAEAIKGYYKFLDSDFAKIAEAEPFVEVIQKMVSSERDHLNALNYLYEATTKSKPATDMAEAARAAIADFRERNKLIK